MPKIRDVRPIFDTTFNGLLASDKAMIEPEEFRREALELGSKHPVYGLMTVAEVFETTMGAVYLASGFKGRRKYSIR